jgi:hypothetical protein
MRGRAMARMKVDIGLLTTMMRRFLRMSAQICLRKRFITTVIEIGNEDKKDPERKHEDMKIWC